MDYLTTPGITASNQSIALPDSARLSEADRFKLHNEINQCNNHRFLLTGTAIALFGVMAPHFFPKSTPPTLNEVAITASLSAVYSVLLGVLFYQSRQLRKVVRTYSTYLRAKQWSEWERDWYAYRTHEHRQRDETGQQHSTADLRAHASVFMAMALLTFLSLGGPIVATFHLSGQEKAWGGGGVGVAASMAVTCCILIYRWSRTNEFPLETTLFDQWRKVPGICPDTTAKGQETNPGPGMA